jgi:hypothetical protein
MNKIKLIFSVLFFAFLLKVNAQMPPNAGGMGKINMPAIGRVYGKVIDASTKQVVEFCSVALFTMRTDSAIAGALTKMNGEFSLDNLPFGMFKLRVKFIGYKMYEQQVMINPQSIERDLGNIKIEQDVEMLKAVEVTEEKATMTMSIDRKIYNVSKDLTTQGGNGLDAVKNIPSVSVDPDGNVTLRNSGVQLFIDGRPTTLTLQQIPADQIDRIEVITNPSVKFDASSTGGILNVVMKKNNLPGYNGTVMLGIGTNNRYNGMANINIKEKPWGFSLSANYNQSQNNNKGYTYRENITNPIPVKYFDQNNLSINKNQMSMVRGAIDYSINNRNTLTLSGNYSLGTNKSDDNQKSFTYNEADVLTQAGVRDNYNYGSFGNYTAQLGYRKTFPKPNKELTSDFSYNHGNTDGGYEFSSLNTFTNNGSSYNTLEINKALGSSDMYNFQIDYSNPINDSNKIEYGIKSNYKQSRNSNAVMNYSYAIGEFINDTVLSNNYAIDDIVNGAYINYIKRIKKTTVQAGLRFEQSYYQGHILNKVNQDFGYQYPNNLENIFKSLFPGLFISRKLSEKSEFQVNFSRKINRPNFFQLMPFIMFADRYNYRIGNPTLKPEFVNMGELNYNYVKKNLNYLVSLYGRYTENVITNIAYPNPNDATILINTFANGKSSFTYGLENTLKLTFFKNLNVTTNITTNYVYINASDGNGNNYYNKGFTYEGKIIASYKFPLDITFQANANYEGPKPLAQGQVKEMYFMDLSLVKTLKQRITFNLSLSDVFNTKRRLMYYDTPDYIQEMARRRESRYLKFSVTWMFGKMDASVFKRKSTNKNGRGESNEGMDF